MKALKKKEYLENFEIFIKSLYSCKKGKEEKLTEESANMITSFKEGLRRLGPKVYIIVEVKYVVAGKEEKQTYSLEDLAKDGLQLPEKVESFEVVFNGKSIIKVGDIKTSDGYEPLFITDKFIVEQNASKEIKKGTSDIIIKDTETYQEFSNNRIRFGEVNTLEI